MIQLVSKRSVLNDFFSAVAIGLAIVTPFTRNTGFINAALFTVPLCLVPWLIYWITIGRRPAAWVSSDCLYIKSWPFSTTKISKTNIEYMRYETGHMRSNRKEASNEMHRLIIKMKGYEEWSIPIVDRTDHMIELRLYNFICDNFFPLGIASAS